MIYPDVFFEAATIIKEKELYKNHDITSKELSLVIDDKKINPELYKKMIRCIAEEINVFPYNVWEFIQEIKAGERAGVNAVGRVFEVSSKEKDLKDAEKNVRDIMRSEEQKFMDSETFIEFRDDALKGVDKEKKNKILTKVLDSRRVNMLGAGLNS